MDNANWQTDLETYICQGEPDKIEKTNVWRMAIGLQDVDGLKTSDYLLDTAKAHIEGKISISDADRRIFIRDCLWEYLIMQVFLGHTI